MSKQDLFFMFGVLVVMTVVALLGVGCPSPDDDIKNMIIKAVSKSGCEGCNGCNQQEDEGEGENGGETEGEFSEGEVINETEGEGEDWEEGEDELEIEGEGEPDGEHEQEGEDLYEGEVLPEGEGENIIEGEAEFTKIVPSLIGMNKNEAKRAIEAANLTPGTINEITHPSITEGAVCYQNPAEGSVFTNLVPVDFSLSKGPELLRAPRVVGLTMDEAQIEVLNSGCSLNQTSHSFSSSFSPGLIFLQNPEAETFISPGQEISVSISSGALSGTIITEGSIGPEGGVIAVTESNHLFAGFSITIPATGITESVHIKLLNDVQLNTPMPRTSEMPITPVLGIDVSAYLAAVDTTQSLNVFIPLDSSELPAVGEFDPTLYVLISTGDGSFSATPAFEQNGLRIELLSLAQLTCFQVVRNPDISLPETEDLSKKETEKKCLWMTTDVSIIVPDWKSSKLKGILNLVPDASKDDIYNAIKGIIVPDAEEVCDYYSNRNTRGPKWTIAQEKHLIRIEDMPGGKPSNTTSTGDLY